MNFLRLHVLPPLAKHLFSSDAVRKFAFPLVSQIGINYRHGSLSNHLGDEDFEVKAGDRMPFVLLDGNSIYDKLFQPKFHQLAFLSEPSKLQMLRNEVASQYAELIDFNAFAISPEVAEVFGTDKDFSVLLRPDNHVGLISANISPSGVEKYLTEFIGYNRRQSTCAGIAR